MPSGSSGKFQDNYKNYKKESLNVKYEGGNPVFCPDSGEPEKRMENDGQKEP